MSKRPHHGSDLLLGLSLAEIFMLFVLLIWLDTMVRIHATEPPANMPRARTYRELLAQRDSLAREAARFRGFADIVPLNYRHMPSDSLKHLIARGLALVNAGRGAPACYKSNVLFEAVVRSGVTTVVVRRGAQPEALVELRDLGAPNVAPGDSLSTESDVAAFLGAIDHHNASRPCRFDYLLIYVSNDDRVNGEDRFERYCYTAGRKRIAR